jgi:hypothetical protein
MRKDVREFIRRLEAVGVTVESTPGHYRVLREGKPLRKANGMPFTLPFRPTRSAGAERRSSSCASSASTCSTSARNAEAHRCSPAGLGGAGEREVPSGRLRARAFPAAARQRGR